ncbi:Rha family transcriptional regulator, partial [Capnocytophaga gingivalis]
MNELINTIEQTMSSFEIAKLTGKRHDHVIRDIRELNKGYGNLHLPKIGLMFKITELPNGAKRNDPYFELTKMQTFDLLTGYNT